jgi:hypothetical protein
MVSAWRPEGTDMNRLSFAHVVENALGSLIGGGLLALAIWAVTTVRISVVLVGGGIAAGALFVWLSERHTKTGSFAAWNKPPGASLSESPPATDYPLDGEKWMTAEELDAQGWLGSPPTSHGRTKTSSRKQDAQRRG